MAFPHTDVSTFCLLFRMKQNFMGNLSIIIRKNEIFNLNYRLIPFSEVERKINSVWWENVWKKSHWGAFYSINLFLIFLKFKAYFDYLTSHQKLKTISFQSLLWSPHIWSNRVFQKKSLPQPKSFNKFPFSFLLFPVILI